MRWLSCPLLFCLLLPGCASLSTGASRTQADACANCDDGSCSWCSSHLCAGRHPHYFTLVDAVITRQEARRLAKLELRDLDAGNCLNCDYRLGFEQAFVDVSVGASGEVPALPPENYWRSWNRTSEGHVRAQNWFAGYAAGATRAVPIYEPFNQVASSGLPGYELTGHSLPQPAVGPPGQTWQHSLAP